MEITMKILCEEYKHKKIIDNKIIIDEPSEEYYIIPITKQFKIETDENICQLTFTNQLLWLKYSNHKKQILIKDYNYDEAIVIPSKNIIDIYINIHTTNYFRKNVWQSKTSVSLNKKYDGQYIISIPIIEDMISIKEYGIGIKNYQIHMISNEILLKKTTKRSNTGCNYMVTNNFLLNKDALFIKVSDDDAMKFIQ